MTKERLRAILKDLCPPLLARWIRGRQVQHAVPRTPGAAVHQVTGGPLKGGRLLLDLGSPAYRAMCDGRYDDFVWPALPHVADINGRVLDVGAHIGYDTLVLARLYPENGVVAFEPEPMNLARIQANLALNPELATRVEVAELALADTSGFLSFHTSGNVDDETSSGGYLGSVRPPLDEKVYVNASFRESKVPVGRLDELVEERGWGRIGLMKIDVEGAEHLVLAGALGVLRRDKPFLCIEVHSIACMIAVMDLLEPMGYVITLIHEHRPGRAHIIAR